MVFVIVNKGAFANNSKGVLSMFALCSCFVSASKFPTAISRCGTAPTDVLFKTGTRLVSFIREYYHALLWDATPTEEWGRNILVSSFVQMTNLEAYSFLADRIQCFEALAQKDRLLNNIEVVPKRNSAYRKI